jgi:hypothetical protein
LNQADNAAHADLDHDALVTGATRALEETTRRRSKKEQILSTYESGVTDIAQIVHSLGIRPSYVAQVLQNAGLISGYFDLFSSNSDPANEVNVYSRFFRGVLQYKTVEAAQASVQQIDRLYNYFERLNDRAGQHHAMVIALTGKNRARWSGKRAQAALFHEWLMTH